MASTVLSLVALFITLFQPPFASCDFLAPLLSPVIGNFCKEVGCGKGKCKMSENGKFPYECECDPGWKQTLSSNSSAPALKFLPCVIPNCTVNYHCSEAAAPAPAQETPFNASIFEPCHWANCGGGVCNKTTALTYACECKTGYYNLLNNTGFPCFQECSIGGDCSNLGISVSNKSTSPAPNLSETGSNRARSLQQEDFRHMIVLLISIAVVL